MVDTGINTSGPQLSSHDLIGQGVCVCVCIYIEVLCSFRLV